MEDNEIKEKEQDNENKIPSNDITASKDDSQNFAPDEPPEPEPEQPEPKKKEPTRDNGDCHDDDIIGAKLAQGKRRQAKNGVAAREYYHVPTEPSKFPATKTKANLTEAINDHVGNLENNEPHFATTTTTVGNRGRVRAAVEPSLLDVSEAERGPTFLERKRQIAGLDRAGYKQATRTDNTATKLTSVGGSVRRSSEGLASIGSSMRSNLTTVTAVGKRKKKTQFAHGAVTGHAEEETIEPLEDDSTPGAFRSYPSGTPPSVNMGRAVAPSLYYSTSNHVINPNQDVNDPSNNNHVRTNGDYLIEAFLVPEAPSSNQDTRTRNNETISASDSTDSSPTADENVIAINTAAINNVTADNTIDSPSTAIVTATKESWWQRINPLWIVFATLLLVGILGIIIYFSAFVGRLKTSPTLTFAPTSPPIPTRMLAIQFLQQLIVNEIDALQERIFVSPDGSAVAKFSTETSMAFQDEESPQFRAVEWIVDNTVLPNIDMVLKNETKNDSFVKNNDTILLEDDATIVIFGTNSTPIIQSLMQQFALVVVYFSTGGDEGYWINDSGWLSSTSVTTTTKSNSGNTSGDNSIGIFDNVECDWFLGFDVACEEIVIEENVEAATATNTSNSFAIRVVTRLLLSDNNITGNFPNEIALLSPSLIELDVSNTHPGENSLIGILPPTLALLSRLQRYSFANHNRLLRRDLFLFEQNFYGILVKPLEITHQNLSNTNRVGGLNDGLSRIVPRLEVLDVSNNDLSSSLPTFIQELSHLRILDLSNNVLTSSVPINIDTFSLLEVLDLSNNRFTGDINIFFSPRLSSLKVLNLHGNDFSGSLSSDSVDLVPTLETLKLGDNLGLTQSTLPSKLGLLTRLTTLEGYGINLVGSLPSELLDLTQLVTLDFSGNFLTGTLPTNLLFGGQFKNLTTIQLGNNEFEGTGFLSSSNISSAVSAAGNTRHSPIEFLDLSKNSFRGSLGGELFELFQSTLTTLKLNECDLSGEMPTELGLATNLERLELSSNTFEGTIPSEIINLKSLRILDLSTNILVGRLPDLFQRASSLEHVNLNFNLLTGTLLPESVGNLANLTSMSIRSNEITGSFPIMISLANLEHVDLGDIRLTGTFPSLISRLTKLTTLLLDINLLSGPMPSEIGQLSTLLRLDLSSNNLNTTLPSEIGLLSQLTSLDLSRNLFSGMLPLELMNLDSLRIFRINSNELSGFIPTSICGFQVRSLSVVDCDMVICDCCGCPDSTFAPFLPTTVPTLSPIVSLTAQPTRPTQRSPSPSVSPAPTFGSTPAISTTPPSLPNDNFLCVIGLQIDCVECSSITENLPFRPECIERPLTMKFRFNGGGCSQSNNIQPPSLVTCNDIVAGGPPSISTESSFVVVQDVRGTIYHENFVAPGSEYELAVPARGIIGSRLNITVYSSSETTFDTQLQTIMFDSSCARSILFLGDRFGSLELIEFRNEEQEVVSIFQSLTFVVTVENLGESSFSLVSLLGVGNEGGITNLTAVAEGTILMGGESVVFEYSDVLDTGTADRYSQLVLLRASDVSKSGAECDARNFFRLLGG